MNLITGDDLDQLVPNVSQLARAAHFTIKCWLEVNRNVPRGQRTQSHMEDVWTGGPGLSPEPTELPEGPREFRCVCLRDSIIRRK